MKLPMNADIYSIGFAFDPLWRRIVGGATGTRATIIKWPLGGLSNLFIFISGQTYGEAFTAILNACDERNLIPSPTSITCDFEIAIHNAIQTMFGAGVRIQGCFYHLTQSNLEASPTRSFHTL